MNFFRYAAFALATLLFAGCRENKPATAATSPVSNHTQSMNHYDNEVAVISTTEGELTLAFRSDKAPKSVENFKKLAREGYYDGTAFHRIIKGFMAQGGDPKTKDLSKEAEWGTGGPGYSIPGEFSENGVANDIPHERGVISMARSNNPNSGGSQFFLCDSNARFLDGKYAAFGKIIKGDDVLQKILDTPVTRSFGGEASRPTRRVEIKSVKIVPAE